LEAQGLTQNGDGVWAQRGAPEPALTPNEVAHARTSDALHDPDLDAAARLRLAFGLVDLLDAAAAMPASSSASTTCATASPAPSGGMTRTSPTTA